MKRTHKVNHQNNGSRDTKSQDVGVWRLFSSTVAFIHIKQYTQKYLNFVEFPYHVSNCFFQFKFPEVDVLQPLAESLRDLGLGGVSLVLRGLDQLLGLLPRVLRLAPVLLALEVLVLIVTEPVVSVPLLEGVSVHRVGGDVAVKDWLFFYLVIIYKSFYQMFSRYTELLAWMTFYPAYYQYFSSNCNFEITNF